jgi:hypothetical protein
MTKLLSPIYVITEFDCTQENNNLEENLAKHYNLSSVIRKHFCKQIKSEIQLRLYNTVSQPTLLSLSERF